MRPYIFFIILLIVSIPSAEAGVIEDAKAVKFVTDLLGREYWDGDWIIASEQGTPAKSVKSSRHIRAWIDIIGFKDESVINETRYVDGIAKDFAIVKRHAWHTPVNGKVVSFTSTYNIADGHDMTTATQSTTFHWKKKKCGVFGCHWVHYWEYLTVSHTTESPENFTTRIPNMCVYIKSYNRTFNPVTYIYIQPEMHPSMEDVMISRVRYNGSNISRYAQVGWVMKNDRGTEYVEFVDGGIHPLWHKDENQSMIDHCGRLVTIFDPDFNESLLNISLHTPYETRYITNYSMDIVTGNAKVNIPLVKIILLLIGSAMAIIILMKVVKYAL
jgi:hypothetical protein